MKEVKIYVEDNGNRDYEDTDILLKQLKKEYDKPRPIILQLADIEGQIVTGRCNLVVGTLEEGSFLLTGNVNDVIFVKDKVTKAIDEVCDDINLLVVNEFIPFVTETRVYLPEAIDILETEKQNTIFAILTTEDDQIGTDKIPSMQKFVLAVDIALYLMKRYGSIFCDFDINKCCTPKYLGENTAIGCRDGQCNCGNIVRSYQDYCDACGVRLCWDNVHA